MICLPPLLHSTTSLCTQARGIDRERRMGPICRDRIDFDLSLLETEGLNQSVVHVCGDSKVLSELFASEDGGFFHISDLIGLYNLYALIFPGINALNQQVLRRIKSICKKSHPYFRYMLIVLAKIAPFPQRISSSFLSLTCLGTNPSARGAATKPFRATNELTPQILRVWLRQTQTATVTLEQLDSL